MRTLSLLALLLLACTGKEDDTAPTTEGDADTDTDTDVDTNVAPVILTAEVNCTKQQSAGEVWDTQNTVDDPQGVETVDGGTFSVLNEDGGELTSGQLACGSGTCFGTWREQLTGVGCSAQGEILVRFVVTDIDGNSSEPFDFQTQ